MNYQLIGIHGVPRSGTSWLGQLFNSHAYVAYRYQPFFAHAFRARIDTHSRPDNIRRLFDDVFVTRDAFVTQSGEARLAREAPNFKKASPTHLVYKEVRFHDLMEPILAAVPQSRMIGIVRDPLQVLESWAAAPREFKPEWSIKSEWRRAPSKNAGLPENWYGFERWKALAYLFLELEQRYLGRFLVVRYTDLIQDPFGSVEKLFHFAGLSPSLQTMQFISESTSRDDGDPYGVYRAGPPSKHAAFPNEIGKIIRQELANSALARFIDSRP